MSLSERYSRQLSLKGFGAEGQQKLSAARVLMIGAGGLGCAALQYLAAAGVGHIGIVDDDVVSLSNLHRQVLYTTNDIGLHKAATAKEKLAALNPEISIIAYCEWLGTANALELIAAYDIVVDGTDNFTSRYLINDACVLLNRPVVFGAVSQYEGQVAVFNYIKNAGDIAANYRDIFPVQPAANEVPNCAEAGVLGVLPGIIGTMQASETIKLLTGTGKALVNELLTYNALNNQVFSFTIHPNKDTRLLIPADRAAFENRDYDWVCDTGNNDFEIGTDTFTQMIHVEGVTVVDVRDAGEWPVVDQIPCLQIPLAHLESRMDEIETEQVIFFCKSGSRSLQAAKILSGIFGNSRKIYSLRGGIENWLKATNNLQA